MNQCASAGYCCNDVTFADTIGGYTPSKSRCGSLSCSQGCEFAYYAKTNEECKSKCASINSMSSCLPSHPYLQTVQINTCTNCNDCNSNTKGCTLDQCAEGCDKATLLSGFYNKDVSLITPSTLPSNLPTNKPSNPSCFGKTCTNNGDIPCCSGYVCSGVGGTCCGNYGGSCTSSSDCCFGICGSSSTCCRDVGQSTQNSGDCCSGYATEVTSPFPFFGTPSLQCANAPLSVPTISPSITPTISDKVYVSFTSTITLGGVTCTDLLSPQSKQALILTQTQILSITTGITPIVTYSSCKAARRLSETSRELAGAAAVDLKTEFLTTNPSTTANIAIAKVTNSIIDGSFTSQLRANAQNLGAPIQVVTATGVTNTAPTTLTFNPSIKPTSFPSFKTTTEPSSSYPSSRSQTSILSSCFSTCGTTQAQNVTCLSNCIDLNIYNCKVY